MLTHVTNTIECIEAGAPVDLVFQSIGGTEATNSSFGFNLNTLAEAQDAALSLKRGTVGNNVMYFETMGSNIGSTITQIGDVGLAAYKNGFNYLQIGLELLTHATTCWQQRYELMLALHGEAAEAAYLVGDAGGGYIPVDEWKNDAAQRELMVEYPVENLSIDDRTEKRKKLAARVQGYQTRRRARFRRWFKR